jgi:hypothetical protein
MIAVDSVPVITAGASARKRIRVGRDSDANAPSPVRKSSRREPLQWEFTEFGIGTPSGYGTGAVAQLGGIPIVRQNFLPCNTRVAPWHEYGGCAASSLISSIFQTHGVLMD